MTESKKISGVDPNSYGAFDKSVDWMSKHLKVILPVVTMGSAAMAACDKLATENLPTETATLPSSATPTPFVEVTPTPFVEVTPTVEATMTQEMIIDKNIKDFLEGEGQFSDEELKKIIFTSEFALNEVKDDLGVVVGGENGTETDSIKAIQGVVLGNYIDKNDDFIVLIGSKNYKGERIVIPFFQTDEVFNFGFPTAIDFLKVKKLSWEHGVNHTGDDLIILSDVKDLNKKIDSKVGDVIIIYLFTEYSSRYDTAIKESVISAGGNDEDISKITDMWKRSMQVSKEVFEYLNKIDDNWKSVDKDTSSDFMLVNSGDDLINFDYNKAPMLSSVVFSK